MERLPFVFTVLFMLLGPIKLIPAFAALTPGADEPFKRAVAIRGALIATIIVAGVATLGTSFLAKYNISINAVRIGGGLVLLLAALKVMFGEPSTENKGTSKTPMQLAISPLATGIMVPPAGVAAILIFVLLESDYPGIVQVVYGVLAVIMALNFLVMYFHTLIMKIPGLMMVLQVLGAILIFMQVGLATETIITAFRQLGVIS